MSEEEDRTSFRCLIAASHKEDLVKQLRWMADQIERGEVPSSHPDTPTLGGEIYYAYRGDPAADVRMMRT